MPSLGADMASGKLLEWHVKPGEKVKRGQVIAVAGTEKGDIDVEVFEDGIVGDLLIPIGSEIPVGAVLAYIGGEEVLARPAKVAEKVLAVAGPGEPVAMAVRPAVEAAAALPGGNGHRLSVSPLARKLAADLGVDLSKVHGTGPGG